MRNVLIFEISYLRNIRGVGVLCYRAIAIIISIAIAIVSVGEARGGRGGGHRLCDKGIAGKITEY